MSVGFLNKTKRPHICFRCMQSKPITDGSSLKYSIHRGHHVRTTPWNWFLSFWQREINQQTTAKVKILSIKDKGKKCEYSLIYSEGVWFTSASTEGAELFSHTYLYFHWTLIWFLYLLRQPSLYKINTKRERDTTLQ